VQQVGDVISKQFEKAYGSCGAHLDAELDYTTGFIKFVSRGCKVIMFDTTAKYLMNLLGIPCTKHTETDCTKLNSAYDKWTTYKVNGSLEGTKKPHLDVMHSMYVYSDMIEAQPVGDVEAPLLGDSTRRVSSAWRARALCFQPIKLHFTVCFVHTYYSH